jgi:hypothetical protein
MKSIGFILLFLAVLKFDMFIECQRKGRLIFNSEMNNLNEVNSDWRQETGGNGWGNNELQFYTDKNANIFTNGKFILEYS